MGLEVRCTAKPVEQYPVMKGSSHFAILAPSPRARAAECDCRRSARVACRGHQRLAAFTARGWVEVRPHHSDGRTNLVSLTAAGADLSTAAWQGLAASHDGADDGVDHVQLQRSLERVIGNAERHLS